MSLEKELGSALDRGKITTVIVDADDTIQNSSKLLWGPAFKFFSARVAEGTGKNKGWVLRRTRQINNEIFRRDEWGVHPGKYHEVAVRIADEMKYDPEKSWKLMKITMAMIYLAQIPLMRGAEKTIKTIQKTDRKVAVLSHSPQGRLELMRQGWNVENIEIFGWTTRQRKGQEAWAKAMKGMGATGREAIAVDDNLSSVLAAKLAGIETAVWIKPVWKEYAEGNAQDLIMIDRIGQLVPALISHFK